MASAQRRSLDSSLLASARYSEEATLDIEFHSGATYRYFAVPRSIFDSLLSAESKGAFFNRHIRNRFHSQLIGP
jgi:hypothetical protein